MSNMQKSNGWTPERKARQAALIRAWKPWQKSTGPRTAAGKAKASRNAFTGGHTVMLRRLAKVLNAAMREQRKFVESDEHLSALCVQHPVQN